jgi:hypothetical protein
MYCKERVIRDKNWAQMRSIQSEMGVQEFFYYYLKDTEISSLA